MILRALQAHLDKVRDLKLKDLASAPSDIKIALTQNLISSNLYLEKLLFNSMGEELYSVWRPSEQLSAENLEEVLVKLSFESGSCLRPESFEVRVHDYLKLDPGVFLNDTIINFCIRFREKYLSKR